MDCEVYRVSVDFLVWVFQWIGWYVYADWMLFFFLFAGGGGGGGEGEEGVIGPVVMGVSRARVVCNGNI